MQKTIIMVDDHVANLAKVEELLEKQYLVITLTSAAKMFAVLEKIIPDLILLDIDMPEMDGLEAIKLLKQSAKYSKIPVIFVTGLTGADTEAYGIELGAVDFIAKPFSEPVLINRIKTHLQMADLIRAQAALLHQQGEKFDRMQEELAHSLADIEEVLGNTDSKGAAILNGIKNRLESVRKVIHP